MTRDEIIRMAREASKMYDYSDRQMEFYGLSGESLYGFAVLVAAAEREKVQREIDFLAKAYETVSQELSQIMEQQSDEIKAAIRARGQE